jgi:hypothetical protein
VPEGGVLTARPRQKAEVANDSTTVSDETRTEFANSAVEHLSRLMLRAEETHPMPPYVSPAALLASVVERLCRAGVSIAEWKSGEGDGSAAEIGALFAEATANAVQASARIDPEFREGAITDAKDALVAWLDEVLEHWIARAGDAFRGSGPNGWLPTALGLLTGPCVAVCRLEAMPAPGADEEGGLATDADPSECLAAMAESLNEFASWTIGAAQWFLDRHKEESGDEYIVLPYDKLFDYLSELNEQE